MMGEKYLQFVKHNLKDNVANVMNASSIGSGDKMKVLQIANDYLGTTLYTALFNALIDTGVTNVIFVPVRNTGGHRNENDSLRKDNGSSVIICPCFSSLDRLVFYGKQKKVFKAITQAVDVKNISVIHAHTLFSAGYTARELRKEFDIPYIVAVRNVDVNVFFKRMKHLKNVGVDILKDADKIVFLSPAYKRVVLDNYVSEDIRDQIERKSVVIPNGISEFFLENKPDIDSRPKRTVNREKVGAEKQIIKLIYAGEINHNKNLTETINACKLLMAKGYDCRYTVVGDITEKSCRNILDEKYIKHYPRCGHDELIKHYRNSDIFVMPSHTETFGLVYAEAMSQGVPVIYTRGQGFDGHFEDGVVGYSVSDQDARELADKIEMVLQDYDGMSKRCINGSKRFNWNTIAKEYKRIYCLAFEGRQKDNL